MRLRTADRTGWRRVLAKRFVARRIDTPDYHGYVSLLRIDEIEEPLSVIFEEERVLIADCGYDWLQHFPDGAHYVLLAAFDERGELVQWYIDIIGGMGVDERGIPWYDDLYLDIVISSEGKMLLLDVEELDEALQQGEVTSAAYNFAWREASTILTALEEDLFPLLWLGERHRKQLSADMKNA